MFSQGCDRKNSDTAKQLEELQQKASEAEERRRDLERELEEQKASAERGAIERDRLQIEIERAELEQEQGEAAAAKAEEIRKREEALAKREGKLEQIRADLEEEQADLSNRGAQLNDRERELAGREALPFQDEEQTEPVGDYGVFYDSLSSYGSWFETPDYGYVWQPVVVSDSNWRPYSRGRWVCTDRGWTWVSDEPFGWATYHYGRWALVRGRGWVWVPGTEWAPCWVSWRENRNHIGWAPLPPETMAYRNHRWDSSVDVQFGIGASCFTFVEYRHFGSPLYQHCLPLSQNSGCYGSTTNITYIHFQNRQVICGGPRYKEACDRIGRPIQFCRLQIDRHRRPGGNLVGIRPQIKGDRLLVSAPNMDAEWNGSLKPNRIKGRMDSIVVERNQPLRPEIAERYQKNRQENVRIAERSIQQMGGSDNFRQRRIEQLDENRNQVVKENRPPGKSRESVQAPVPPEAPEREIRPQPKVEEIVQIPNQNPAEPKKPRPGTLDQNDPRRPGIGTPGVYPREGLRPQQQRLAEKNPAADVPGETPRIRPQRDPERIPAEQPRVDPQEESNQRQRQTERMREEQSQGAEQQQREIAKQRQQEQQQAREELQKQRQAEEAREVQREQNRQRQQAQEEARQRQKEQAREEQARQQREMERSRQQQQEENQRQEQARQERQEENRRQEEQARQQRQEENRRQEEQSRQRQQEENQRQRQQQEKDQKDQDEQRRKNR